MFFAKIQLMIAASMLLSSVSHAQPETRLRLREKVRETKSEGLLEKLGELRGHQKAVDEAGNVSPATRKSLEVKLAQVNAKAKSLEEKVHYAALAKIEERDNAGWYTERYFRRPTPQESVAGLLISGISLSVSKGVADMKPRRDSSVSLLVHPRSGVNQKLNLILVDNADLYYNPGSEVKIETSSIHKLIHAADQFGRHITIKVEDYVVVGGTNLEVSIESKNGLRQVFRGNISK